MVIVREAISILEIKIGNQGGKNPASCAGHFLLFYGDSQSVKVLPESGELQL